MILLICQKLMDIPSSEVVMERERCPFFLGNIILLKEKGGMRESVPRQVDRESRDPQGDRKSVV